jgi:transcriptional regulator with XRE-family HTH domain
MVSPSIRFPAGPVLRERREARGVTREQLADDLTRSAQTVALWESGRVRPTRSVLVRLSQLIDVPLSELEQ